MIMLDTNVIIDLGRGRSAAKKILENFKETVFAISAITIQEIYVGLGYILEKHGKELYEINKEKSQILLEDYTILKITKPILELSGLNKGKLRAKGVTIEIQDLIIGSTAEILGAEKIITRNPKHFKVFKVPIESYELE
ncbi:MAG: PIN domain-containing protein [Candidatus Lokiarchaeota archaeon]|nr:PIN domain-containing protein [Candidatus Lokiarchaeota archaeon]